MKLKKEQPKSIIKKQKIISPMLQERVLLSICEAIEILLQNTHQIMNCIYLFLFMKIHIHSTI